MNFWNTLDLVLVVNYDIYFPLPKLSNHLTQRNVNFKYLKCILQWIRIVCLPPKIKRFVIIWNKGNLWGYWTKCSSIHHRGYFLWWKENTIWSFTDTVDSGHLENLVSGSSVPLGGNQEDFYQTDTVPPSGWHQKERRIITHFHAEAFRK